MTPDERGRLVRAAAAILLPGAALVLASGLLLRLHALSADGAFPRALMTRASDLHALLGGSALAALIALLFGPRIVHAVGDRPPSVTAVLAMFGASFLAVGIPLFVFVFVTAPLGDVTRDPMPLTLGVGALAVAIVTARRDLTTAALVLFGIAAIVIGVMYVVPLAIVGPLEAHLVTALTVVALAAAIEPLLWEAPTSRAALGVGLALLYVAPLTWWLNAPEQVERLATLSSLGVPIVLSAALRGAWLSRKPEAAAAIAAVLLAGPAWAVDRLAAMAPIHLHDTLVEPGALHLRVGGILCAVMACHPRVWNRPRWAGSGLGFLMAGGAAFGGGFIVLGLDGMPTRYLSYDASFTRWQWVSSAGALALVIGCALVAIAARPTASATA